MKYRILVASIVVAGCVPLHPSAVGTWQEIAIYPRVASLTQSLVNPLSLSSIATLDIIPYVSASGSYYPISSITGNPTTVGSSDVLKLTQASPTIDPGRPFILRKIKPNQNYRVYGRAYDASNAQISQDTTSYVDLAVGNNDAPSMATLPVNLLPVPFAATTSITINTDGHYDYLKSTLYLLSGNTQVAMAQTTRTSPDLQFGNLQGNTNYRLIAEAYKLNAVVSSTSLDFSVANDTTVSTQSLSFTIPYVVTTLAGINSAGFQDGTGNVARFRTPMHLAVDPQGMIYAADCNNHCIRKITPQGVVTTLAGNGVAGTADGVGTAASFSNPRGIVSDSQGNLYVADFLSYRIRKVTPGGVVTTLAGNGTDSNVDGTGVAACIGAANALAFDSSGNLYVATETAGGYIRRITPGGVVTTVAGNGAALATDGAALSASFLRPRGIAVDSQGVVYIADCDNGRLRRLSGGTVTTLLSNGTWGNAGAGTAMSFNNPWQLTIDEKNNLYVAESTKRQVKRISASGVATVLAGGNGTQGFVDGTGGNARFLDFYGVVLDGQGNIYVADSNNHAIRKLQ